MTTCLVTFAVRILCILEELSDKCNLLLFLFNKMDKQLVTVSWEASMTDVLVEKNLVL